MKTTQKCNLPQLQKIAQNIAKTLKAQDVVALSGDLGAGKTTFAQHIINTFVTDNVTSPTFNLVNLYDTNNFVIWHFDLYRLKDINEVYNLGIEDAFNNGVSIIEWPQIIKNILPQHTIHVHLEHNNEHDHRTVNIRTNNSKY